MFAKTVLAAVAAAFVATAGLAASTGTAAAEGFGFTIQIGDYDHDYRPHRYDDRYGYRHGYRDEWRWDRHPRWHEARRIQVCEPVWTLRKIRNDRGRVVKVVRVRGEDCRWVRR